MPRCFGPILRTRCKEAPITRRRQWPATKLISRYVGRRKHRRFTLALYRVQKQFKRANFLPSRLGSRPTGTVALSCGRVFFLSPPSARRSAPGAFVALVPTTPHGISAPRIPVHHGARCAVLAQRDPRRRLRSAHPRVASCNAAADLPQAVWINPPEKKHACGCPKRPTPCSRPSRRSTSHWTASDFP